MYDKHVYMVVYIMYTTNDTRESMEYNTQLHTYNPQEYPTNAGTMILHSYAAGFGIYNK